jgi:hypothetical protein
MDIYYTLAAYRGITKFFWKMRLLTEYYMYFKGKGECGRRQAFGSEGVGGGGWFVVGIMMNGNSAKT